MRVSGVDVQAQFGLGREFQSLEVQVQFADGGVAESLPAAAVELDVVAGPMLTERFALGGELADEGDEVLVVRVSSGLESKHRGGVGGHPVVVDEELPGSGIGVDEPSGVGRSLGTRAGDGGVQDRRVQGAGEGFRAMMS